MGKNSEIEMTTKIPSVTKILSETKSEESKQALALWEAKMIRKLGQEGFEKYKQDILDTGKNFHSILENYYKTQKLQIDSEDNQILQNLMDSVEPYLKDFQPLNLECEVVHPDLKYRGYIGHVCHQLLRLMNWPIGGAIKYI